MYRRRGRRSEYPSSVFDAFRPPDDSPLVKGSFSKAAIKMPMTLVFAGCRCLSRDSRGSSQGMKDFDEGTIISVKEIIFLSFLPRSGILIELKEGRLDVSVLDQEEQVERDTIILLFPFILSPALLGKVQSDRSEAFTVGLRKQKIPIFLPLSLCGYPFEMKEWMQLRGFMDQWLRYLQWYWTVGQDDWVSIETMLDAPPVDIDGIREPLSGSLLYGTETIFSLSPLLPVSLCWLGDQCTLTLRRVSFLSLRIRKPASLPKIFREKVLVGHHLLTTERIVNERVLALDLVGNSKRSTPFNFKGNS
ncbi:hypothetical protein LguiB_030327 [Lonicera macranthoides]